jgi:hypothetical protein
MNTDYREHDDPSEGKCFQFLDGLKESGVANMLGAVPYLTELFGIPEKEANEILVNWVKTFGERHPRIEATHVNKIQ